MVALHLLFLVFGLSAVGSLFLAVITNYWLYTSEPFDFEKMILEGQAEINGDDFPPEALQVKPEPEHALYSNIFTDHLSVSFIYLTEESNIIRTTVCYHPCSSSLVVHMTEGTASPMFVDFCRRQHATVKEGQLVSKYTRILGFPLYAYEWILLLHVMRITLMRQDLWESPTHLHLLKCTM